MRIVICGGGVIGAAIAFFLARRGVAATLVERTGIACAASGKSGGFLARDWCDGTPVEPLARRSFALHAELAETMDGQRWGYRRLGSLSVAGSARRDLAADTRGAAPSWLGRGVAVQGRLSRADTTAQVHPASFTRALVEAACARGARAIEGAVEGIALAEDGRAVRGVRVDGRLLDADAAVIALGPWSVLACRWLPLPAVHGLKSHSVVFRSPGHGPGEALFAEFEADDGRVLSPEVYPRPDGTVYVCGLRGTDPLPVDPAAVAPEAGGCETLRAMAARLAPGLATAPVLATQACYRPIVDDGLPVIGAVAGVAGAYVATGHSVWGILNAPATGEAMAELLLDGAARTVDIGAFDPARLPPLDPARVATA